MSPFQGFSFAFFQQLVSNPDEQKITAITVRFFLFRAKEYLRSTSVVSPLYLRSCIKERAVFDWRDNGGGANLKKKKIKGEIKPFGKIIVQMSDNDNLDD